MLPSLTGFSWARGLRKNLPVALDCSAESITVMGSTLSNGSSVASWQNSSVTQRPSQGRLGVIDLDRNIGAIHAMRVRRLVLEGDLPSLYFFKHHLRVAFAGRPVDQILLLTAPSKTALALLPPSYRSVMRAWFRLSRREENGELVIVGSNNSFCPLRSLSVRFLYQQFSRLDYAPHRCVAKFSSWVWQLTGQLCGQMAIYPSC